jgi:topoisomerase-4 subunit B
LSALRDFQCFWQNQLIRGTNDAELEQMSQALNLFDDMPELPKPERQTAIPPKAAPPAPAAVPTVSDNSSEDYGASSIRVLEGLEPVRMRPGMYIGGTDEKALHHLFAEVIDNSMDEAVAGHANFIDVNLDAEGFVTVTDNGRGIPVENHPQMPGKSTLEVIMTKLHVRRQGL